ncbi:Bgt-20836, partial [Blumeria graminis f. sp. tritici]
SIGLVGIVKAGSLPFAWPLLRLARIYTGREILALFFPPGLEAGTAGGVVLLPLEFSFSPLGQGLPGFPHKISAI